jgi:polyisoprenoid-binding protein YceI
VHSVVEPILRPEDATVRYSIETGKGTFTVRAFATGLLSAFAHSPTIAIPDFKGDVFLSPDALEKSTLRLEIDPASLVVTNDISEKDRQEINRRMHAEVLETDSYPEIVYECSRVSASAIGEGQYWIALNGALTLHGATRTQPVSARASLIGDMLRATGEVSIRQSDYGIQPVTAAGGTIKLKDDLKLSFDIFARKQV